MKVSPLCPQTCHIVHKQVQRYILKFIPRNWGNDHYFIIASFRDARIFPLPVWFPKTQITVTEMRESRRSDFIADYSVLKLFVHSIHGIVSTMCCSFILLEITTSSLFRCQLDVEGIQYIAQILTRVNSLLKKHQVNNLPQIYSTPFP